MRVLSRDVDAVLHIISGLKPDELPSIEVEAIAETFTAATRNRSIQFSNLNEDWTAALLSSENEFLEALYESLPPDEFSRIVGASVPIVAPGRRVELILGIQSLALSKRDFALLSLAYRFSDFIVAVRLFSDLPDTPESPTWKAALAFVQFHGTQARRIARERLLGGTDGQRWRYLYVLSLPLGAEGFSEVLDLVTNNPRYAELLGLYLERFGTQRIDGTIRSYVSKNRGLISGLIVRACETPEPSLLESVGRLIADVPEIDIVSRVEVLEGTVLPLDSVLHASEFSAVAFCCENWRARCPEGLK